MTTRDKILAESFKLFLSKGYSEVSVNEIIDAVGITKGGFYHHFKSKEELFNHTMENFIISNTKPFIEIFEDPKKTLKEKLELMCNKVIEVCRSEEMKTLYIDMNVLYQEIRKKNSKFYGMLVEEYKKSLQVLENAFDEAKKEKILREDLDCPGAAFHFLAYLKGAGVYSIFLEGEDFTNNVQFFIEQFWNSVKK